MLDIGFKAHIVSDGPHSADEIDSLDFAWIHDQEFVRAALS